MTWASYVRLRVPARCRVYRVQGLGFIGFIGFFRV